MKTIINNRRITMMRKAKIIALFLCFSFGLYYASDIELVEPNKAKKEDKSNFFTNQDIARNNELVKDSDNKEDSIQNNFFINDPSSKEEFSKDDFFITKENSNVYIDNVIDKTNNYNPIIVGIINGILVLFICFVLLRGIKIWIK